MTSLSSFVFYFVTTFSQQVLEQLQGRIQDSRRGGGGFNLVPNSETGGATNDDF